MSSSAKIWEKLNKEYGGDMFFRASDPLKFNWEVIDFPMPSLGDAVHCWGLPLGKICQVYGAEGCGKTFLAMIMARETLKKYPDSEVVWLDAETNFDKKWAKRIGLDPDRVIVIPKNEGDELFNALCGRINKEGKKIVPGILDLVAEGHLNVKLIICDSIDSISPPAEQNKDFSASQQYSPHARFLPFVMRRVRPMLVKAKVAMYVINQARDNLNYGGGITYVGGRALRHTLDFSIKLHASKSKDGTLFDIHEKPVGHKIIATVEKCRGGPNRMQAEFWLDFTAGTAKLGEEVAILASAYGVVNRPNNTVWEYKKLSVKGKDNFFKILDEDEKLRTEILSAVKESKAKGADRPAVLSDEGVAELNTVPDIKEDESEEEQD